MMSLKQINVASIYLSNTHTRQSEAGIHRERDGLYMRPLQIDVKNCFMVWYRDIYSYYTQ